MSNFFNLATTGIPFLNSKGGSPNVLNARLEGSGPTS